MNETAGSINQQLDDDYYPLRDPLYIVIPLTVIYTIIFLTGIMGNLITCIVISRNKSMHTATNYYLFSLAVSDLLLLFSGLPQEMYNMWYNYPYPFNEAVCVCQGFAAETSANATVLTITAFTIERYVAICHPFVSHTLSKLSRAVKFVLGMWVLAMCLAIPQTLDLGITHTHYKICTIKRGINRHIFAVSTILVFVFPMTVITILYILIALRLKKSKLVKRDIISGSSVILKHNMFKKTSQKTVVTIHDNSKSAEKLPSDNNNHLTSYQHNHTVLPLNLPENGRINFSTRAQNPGSRHVVNMLVAVVVAFFICWAPFHAQRLFAIYLEDENKNDNVVAIYQFLTHFSGVLYFISTCINPFLYNIMSNKFRQAFKDTLARYLYRRTGGQSIRQGGLSWNISHRSCSYSQSANTCSSICSSQFYNQTNSIRHLDHDYFSMPFHSSKRPLVISFRRMPQQKIIRNNFLSQNNFDVPTSNIKLARTKLRLIEPKLKSKLVTRRFDQSNENNEQLAQNSNQTLNFIRKSTSDTNIKLTYDSVFFYPLNDFHNRYHVDRIGSMDARNKFDVLNYKEMYKMNYKSPYESPEMSLTSKKLEENLNKILEDLVMYQRRTFSLKKRFKSKDRDTILSNSCTKYSLCNSLHELKDKCQSMPTMYYNEHDNIYVDKTVDDDCLRDKNINLNTFLATPVINDTSENINLQHPLHILIKESEKVFD